MDEFSEFLPFMMEQKGFIILCGDFNINLIEADNIYGNEFCDILNRFNLVQLIKTKTHVLGGILDFVIIEKHLENLLSSVQSVFDFKTDHYPIILQIKNHYTKSKK